MLTGYERAKLWSELTLLAGRLEQSARDAQDLEAAQEYVNLIQRKLDQLKDNGADFRPVS